MFLKKLVKLRLKSLRLRKKMFFFNNSFGRFRKQIFVLNENIEIKYIERLFYTSGSILAQGKLLDQSGLGLLCYAACENNDSDVRIYN